MPRKSKSQATTVTAPGQPYGIAGDQQAAMATIPLPNNNLPISSTPSPNANPNVNTPNEVPSPSGFADVLSAAIASPTPGQGAFSAPTERPNQDLLENVAPPQTIQRTNPTIELLKVMAENMGNDPAILETINRLQMQGA